MKFQIIKTCSIDLETERKRISEVCNKSEGKRQLAIVAALEAGDLFKVADLIGKLPYSKTSHCSEKEFVSMAITNLLWELTRVDLEPAKRENPFNKMVIEGVEVKFL